MSRAEPRRRPRHAPPGMSMAEALVAVLVISLLSLIFIVVYERVALKGEGSNLSLIDSAKAMHAEKRLQELHNKVLLYAERYGALPGDRVRSAGQSGDGDGRIEAQEGESELALKDLRETAPDEPDAFLLLGLPVTLLSLEAPPFRESEAGSENDFKNEFEPGNYLRIEGLDAEVASALDQRLDDGAPKKGILLLSPACGDDCATLYYRVQY